MKTKRDQIISKAIEILEGKEEGIHYSDLVRVVSESLTDIPVNTVHGNIWDIEQNTNKIYKPVKKANLHYHFLLLVFFSKSTIKY